MNKIIIGNILYYIGNCAPKKYKEKIYNKSIYYGNDKALYKLGSIFDNEEYLSRAFNKGNKEAAYLLGCKYEKEGDYDMAEYYYSSAILANEDVRAMNNLATIYFNNKNYKQMKKLYLRAIDKGNPCSMYNLGMYYESIGDIDNMKKYYKLAADNNVTHAMVRLGAYYHDIADIDNMFHYYNNAAYNGNTDAIRLLHMYNTTEK